MKRLKVLFGTLLLTVAVMGTFAFTTGDFHSMVNVRCFQFNPATPTAPTVVVQSNYSNASGTYSCPGDKEEYCAVCIDIDAFPSYVTTSGGVTKINTANPTVASTITSNYSNPTQEGVTVNGITFRYRPE